MHRVFPKATFKLGWNVEVLGFNANYVASFDDYLSNRKKTQGLIFEERQTLEERDPLGFINRQLLPELQYHANIGNLIPNVGLDFIASRLIDNSKNFISHCAVGKGADGTIPNTNEPATSDTALQGEISSRHAISSPYPVSVGQAHWDTFFTKDENNDNWTETGLFNASTSGDLFARIKFTTVFPKSTSNTASVNWTSTGTALLP